MRKLLSLAAVCLVALGLAVPVSAQDASQYVNVQSLQVAPEDVEEFLAQVKIVRDAAVEIGLDEAFRWDVYRWDDEIIFASWPGSLADLEDPAAMGRAFAGSSAAGRVTTAMQKAGSLRVNSGETSISMDRPELGYLPANSAVTLGGHGGLYVIQQWPKGDAVPAFEESIKGFMTLLGEMGGRYPIVVNQNVIGDGGYSIIVVFDNLSNFYGEGSLEEQLASDPAMAQRFGQGAAAHSKLITRQESRLVNYLPQHSYRPDLATSQDNDD